MKDCRLVQKHGDFAQSLVQALTEEPVAVTTGLLIQVRAGKKVPMDILAMLVFVMLVRKRPTEVKFEIEL